MTTAGPSLTLDDLAGASRTLLSERWDHRTMGDGAPLPPGLWQDLTALGWFDLLVPASDGGLGLGFTHAGAALEHAGRHLVPGPVFETMTLSADARAAGVGPDAVLTLAVTDAPGTRSTVEGTRLTGTKTLVPYAGDSTALVVVAEEDGEPVVVLVRGDATGLGMQPLDSIDVTQRPCTVTFEAVAVEAVVARGDGARGWIQRMHAAAWSAHASLLLGVMEGLLAMGVEHARTRQQFGVPIGTFGAVRNRLADCYTRVLASRSACRRSQRLLDASEATGPGAADAHRAARVAKAFASAAGRQVAEDVLQVLGGIGFTTEHDCHRYFKRVLSLQAAWGDEAHHARALAGRPSLAGAAG